MAHVELESVTKSFGDVTVIPPLDLAIEKGEFLVLVGPRAAARRRR